MTSLPLRDVSHLLTSGGIYPRLHLSALISEMQAILTANMLRSCRGVTGVNVF